MRKRIVTAALGLLMLAGAVAGGLWWRHVHILAYVPGTLDDAHAHLLRLLPRREIARIRAMPDESRMFEYHHGLGTWMRNNWGLWDSSDLSAYFNRLGVQHADDMSGLILDTFWCKLHDRPFRIEERVAKCREYWRDMERPKGGSPKDGGKIAWVSTGDGERGIRHLGVSVTDRSFWRYERANGRGIEPASSNDAAHLSQWLKERDAEGQRLEDFARD